VDHLAREAVDAAYHVHRSIGPGLLESAYEAILAEHLRRRGFVVDRQVPIEISFEGLSIPDAFRADLLLENRLLIELKSVERLAPVHHKQVLTYIRLMNLPLGLLINFGAELFRDGTKRIINNRPLGALAPWRDKPLKPERFRP
jgi:GxxExxY protein